MPAKLITERFALSAGRVDRSDPARPVVRDAVLCGPVSANKRRYLTQAFEGDRLKRYEGRPIYLNHAGRGDGRRYEDKIARAVNVRRNPHGLPVADLAVNPKHPLAEAFLWDAEHAPDSCGMSHVARCETRAAADGWEEVTEVVEVESIDVVTDPATTKGLYRHEQRKGTAVKKPLRELIEGLRAKLPTAGQKAARKLLLAAEDDAAMGAMMDAPVDAPAEPPADGDGAEDALWGGFWDAITQIGEKYKAGEMTAKDAGRKIMDYIKAHEGLTSDKAPADSGDDYDDAAEEARRRRPDYPALLRECRAAGFASPTDLDLKALAALSESERREYIADRAKGAPGNSGETPRSTGKTAVKEGKGGAVPAGKEFVADIRE